MKSIRPQRKLAMQLLTLSLLLLLLFAPTSLTHPINATSAFLQAREDSPVNTFTATQMTISLVGDNSVTLLPGEEIGVKSPVVTIAAGSEAGYLFAKATESGGFSDYVDWNYNDSWKEVPDNSGYYYRTIGTEGKTLTSDQKPAVFPVKSGEEDIFGQSKGTGYFTARTEKKDGTDITTTELNNQSASLTVKFCYVQLSNLMVEEAFAVAKPNL